jgi:uncharacterized heparinase superfamily protein
MSLLTTARRYGETIRYLKLIQMYHQARRHLLPVRLATAGPVPSRGGPLPLVPGAVPAKTHLGQGRFRFLNRDHDLGWPIAWQAPGLPRLWQYNLHYFAYLQQPDLDFATGLALMRSWLQGCPAASQGVAWEPYPLSLRLVNWIKFLAAKGPPPAEILASLALQALNLTKQIEYLHLGNHLLANGKALWFAGRYLGDESLVRLGRQIILTELPEQFLPDGGHFELSPMYHALAVEDLLDLINLCQAGGATMDRESLPSLGKTAGAALGWLEAMVDQGGQIPLLNDAAYGIAPEFKDLGAYAQRLGIEPAAAYPAADLGSGWQGRRLSGYWVLSHGPMRLLFDTAILGPDYLQAHAHCDMLSVLLDFEGEKIFTDTGVYEYQEGRRRAYARGTAAHNTVVLDGLEQAELWKSFRMGRRGHPQGFRRQGNSLSCGHTGFAQWRRGLFHERTVTLLDGGFELRDRVQGPGQHRFQAFFHGAPNVTIKAGGDGGLVINDRLRLEAWGAAVKVTSSEYYPEFGVAAERPCVVMQGEFSRQGEFGLRCTSFS